MTLKQELEAAGIQTENDLQFPKTNEVMGILKKYDVQWNLFIHDEYKRPWVNVITNKKEELK